MEPGPPWPPAGTAKAAGGGSSFEKSIRGRPGVEGTPAVRSSIGRTVGSSLASLDMEAAMAAVRSLGETGLNSRRRTNTRAQSDVLAKFAETHLHQAGNSPTALGADPNSPDLLPACFGLCQEVLDIFCHVATSLNHGTEEDCSSCRQANTTRPLRQLSPATFEDLGMWADGYEAGIIVIMMVLAAPTPA
ncbi:MAG: hypothetical protein FRX49_12422 [Trebouxia sp. A1-2]|nr:MAG: hypothetical protein FRX49_12422 [Trebouxia sp. A1-2]